MRYVKIWAVVWKMSLNVALRGPTLSFQRLLFAATSTWVDLVEIWVDPGRPADPEKKHRCRCSSCFLNDSKMAIVCYSWGNHWECTSSLCHNFPQKKHPPFGDVRLMFGAIPSSDSAGFPFVNVKTDTDPWPLVKSRTMLSKFVRNVIAILVPHVPHLHVNQKVRFFQKMVTGCLLRVRVVQIFGWMFFSANNDANQKCHHRKATWNSRLFRWTSHVSSMCAVFKTADVIPILVAQEPDS